MPLLHPRAPRQAFVAGPELPRADPSNSRSRPGGLRALWRQIGCSARMSGHRPSAIDHRQSAVGPAQRNARTVVRTHHLRGQRPGDASLCIVAPHLGLAPPSARRRASHRQRSEDIAAVARRPAHRASPRRAEVLVRPSVRPTSSANWLRSSSALGRTPRGASRAHCTSSAANTPATMPRPPVRRTGVAWILCGPGRTWSCPRWACLFPSTRRAT
jgi:hypothetical protein